MAELALAGDAAAGAAILRALVPRPRFAPVDVSLPVLNSAADATAALATLTEAVAAGRITPDAAHSVAGLIARWLEAYAASEIEARLSRLEAANADPSP